MRKYYEITDIGRRKIQEFLDEWEEMQNIYHFVEDAANAGASDDNSQEKEETYVNECE